MRKSSVMLGRALAPLVLVGACTGPTVDEAARADGAADASVFDAADAADAPDAAAGAPQILASARDCPTDLRVFGGAVIWTDQGSLQNSGNDGVVATLPSEGCANGESCVVALAENVRSPSAVEIDPLTGDVYFATVLEGVIWKLSAGSSQPELFGTAQNYPRWLTIDDAALYWTNAGSFGAGDGEVRRAWLEDGTPGGLPIVTALQSPLAIARRGDTLFWTNDGTSDVSGAVMRADLTGAGAQPIAIGQSHPRGLALSGSYVYWANTGDGTIMRARHDGSELVRLIDNRKTPSDVAVDSTHLYWVEAGTPVNYSDGAVVRATLDGTELTVIASEQLDPRRLVLDGEHVYWINRGTQGVSKCAQHDGAVLRAAKPVP